MPIYFPFGFFWELSSFLGDLDGHFGATGILKLDSDFFFWFVERVSIRGLFSGGEVTGSSSSSPLELPVSSVDSSSSSDSNDGSFFFFLSLFFCNDGLELIVLVSESFSFFFALTIGVAAGTAARLLLSTPLVELPVVAPQSLLLPQAPLGPCVVGCKPSSPQKPSATFPSNVGVLLLRLKAGSILLLTIQVATSTFPQRSPPSCAQTSPKWWWSSRPRAVPPS